MGCRFGICFRTLMLSRAVWSMTALPNYCRLRRTLPGTVLLRWIRRCWIHGTKWCLNFGSRKDAMTKTELVRIVLPLLLLPVLVRTAIAGDWPIVTLNDFPEYAVAGTGLNLTFTVRRQGQAFLSGLRPSIRAATTSGLTAKASAAPGKGRGEYTAALTLPQPGEWT